MFSPYTGPEEHAVPMMEQPDPHAFTLGSGEVHAEQRQQTGALELMDTEHAAAAPMPFAQTEKYLAGVMSLSADAKLAAQVARVRYGLDAKVRQVCRSKLVSRLGVGDPLEYQRVAAQGPSVAEPEGLQSLIQESSTTQQHLEAVLEALEDYQRHRQGLADAAQRLGMALQEAGQRASGSFGSALSACGAAHCQAAGIRNEAYSADELHVLSKLRAHHGKAAADCRRTVRQYEACRHELQVLRIARTEAQQSKHMAAGASLLTPTVETDAIRLEQEMVQRLKAMGEVAQGKLAMFQAKHNSDYSASMMAHMKNVAAEEQRIYQALAGIDSTVDAMRRTAPTVQLPRTEMTSVEPSDLSRE